MVRLSPLMSTAHVLYQQSFYDSPIHTFVLSVYDK